MIQLIMNPLPGLTPGGRSKTILSPLGEIRKGVNDGGK